MAGWKNFDAIPGSSAGGLTRLTFVVITLAADAEGVSPPGLRAFVTPTIVHFGAVLALAAFLSIPPQAVPSLSVGFAVIGLGGLVCAGVIAANMRGYSNRYVPAWEDWVWTVALPTIACGACFASRTWSGGGRRSLSAASPPWRLPCCSSASTMRGTSPRG